MMAEGVDLETATKTLLDGAYDATMEAEDGIGEANGVTMELGYDITKVDGGDA